MVPVDVEAAAPFGPVAYGSCEQSLEPRFDWLFGECFPKLNGPRCITQDLHGLQAGNIVEEPTTTREHQHRVALHLQQLQSPLSIGLIQVPPCCLSEKLFDAYRV